MRSDINMIDCLFIFKFCQHQSKHKHNNDKLCGIDKDQVVL